LGKKVAAQSKFMAAHRTPKHVPKSNGRTIEQLEDFRTLLQSVIDYNEPLLAQPGQQRAAARRIAEAKEQIQSLDGEMPDLRG
jgi:hypothetical protein